MSEQTFTTEVRIDGQPLGAYKQYVPPPSIKEAKAALKQARKAAKVKRKAQKAAAKLAAQKASDRETALKAFRDIASDENQPATPRVQAAQALLAL